MSKAWMVVLVVGLLGIAGGTVRAEWFIDGYAAGSQGTTGGDTIYPSRLVYVDNGRTQLLPEGPDGSLARPYQTLQSALIHAVGTANDIDAYMDPAKRYYRIIVAPGVYEENVTIGYRPHIAIDLQGAVVKGTVTWNIPGWGTSFSTNAPIPRISITGDALRSAYMDGAHSIVGIEGRLVVTAPADPYRPQTVFHETHVRHAGISEGVHFEGGSGYIHGHLFTERADIKGVYATNGWGGVTLYANQWGGGHTGGGPPGAGLGPLVGKVLPYNLQDVLISGGMQLWGGNENQYGIWHNVRFEATNALYDVTGALYGIELDTASYQSWLAASQPQERGSWVRGDRMKLSDTPWAAFPAGDYLFGDGNNLFYVSADGSATNQITGN